jgi:hypothetical protein
MTPQVFTEQLTDLINRALEAQASMPRMIYELTMMQQKIINLQLATERREQLAAMSNGIVAAKSMPPNPKN